MLGGDGPGRGGGGGGGGEDGGSGTRRPSRPDGVRKAGFVWLVVAVMAVSGGLLFWRLLAGGGGGPAAPSAPADVDAYGYALAPSLVDRDLVVPSGSGRDGLPALDTPPLMAAGEVDLLNQEVRGKYLVPDDRVIGLALDGVARAYPLRVLAWHEVVNDTLAGRPILVTYHPFSDASAAFSREVAGRAREFGESGLVYDSGLLLYDRDEASEDGPSLWSQLQARAVTGPAAAAGLRLEPLPIAVARWGRWRRLHPETTVPRPAPALLKSYQSDPYGNYFGAPERLRFPVSPRPPAAGPALKDRVVAVLVEGRWRVLPLRTLAPEADRPAGSGEEAAAGPLAAAEGIWQEREAGGLDRSFVRLTVGGLDLVATASLEPATAIVAAEGALSPPPLIMSYWFAWYAQHPPAAEAEEP